MTQYAFFFDGSRCTGCKTCVYACKDKYNLDLGFMYRKVFEYTGGETVKDTNGCFETSCFSYYVSQPCHHCDDPACEKVCPTGAMHKDPETGLVSVDTERCIGCGYCEMACPYDAPKVNRDKGHSVKCDGCADYVAKGEKPACMMACPARAIQFGPVEEIAKMGERLNIAPMPDPSYTNPNSYVKPCEDAKPSSSKDGRVANLKEVF